VRTSFRICVWSAGGDSNVRSSRTRQRNSTRRRPETDAACSGGVSSRKVSMESWPLAPKVGRYPMLVRESHSRPVSRSRVRVTVDAGRGNHFGGSGQVQRGHGLDGPDAASAHHVASRRRGAAGSARRENASGPDQLANPAAAHHAAAAGHRVHNFGFETQPPP